MSTATLSLRNYQRDAILESQKQEALGFRRQLIVMATGLGKTATAVSLARQWREATEGTLGGGKRILWVTHRDELVQQTQRAIELWWPDLDSLGVVKAEQNDIESRFVIASVQTLAVEKRRQQLLDSQLMHGQFGLVVSDEHHHSPAPVWAGVLEALGCGEADGPLMVGLTATPDRADGVGLRATTDKIICDLDIVWAIGNGHLVPPKGITVDVDLSTVKTSGGDYQVGSLGDVLELEGAHAAIAELVTRYAQNRKTIIFTPTVKFAELVTAECIHAGYSAEMVSGETLIPDRQALYARLRSGATKIVVNCAVLTEGFDETSIDCVIVARPTKSRSLFTQMVGRGLRLYPGKEDCLVIALAGTERNKLATLASLAGRSWEQAMKAREAANPEQTMFDFAAEFDRVVEEEAKRAGMKTRTVDLLNAVRKRITWATIGETTFAKKAVSGDRDDKTPQPVIVMKKQGGFDEQWKVVQMNPVKDRNGYTVYRPEPLLTDVDFETAQSFADDTVRRLVPSNLLTPSAPWRGKPPSDKQIELLKKNNVPFIAGNITSGQASDLLDVVFLRRIANQA